MIHMYIKIDVDDEDYNYLYQMCFDNTCMFSIGCTPMIIITLIWLKLDKKVINVSCCRLKSLYHLKPWHV
jgi:hypothetical protein